jgi:ABC-2 type transport system ATP-binding protein
MPHVVFMDEPTLGLDPQSTTEIRKLIRKLNDEQGLTIVLTTHIMNEADVLCDRIGLIDRGLISASGSPSELKTMITEDGHTIVDLDLVDPPGNAFELFRKLEVVKTASQKENRIKVIATKSDAFQDIISASMKLGLRLRNASINQPSLEDVFLHFTGREMIDEVKNKVKDNRRHGPAGRIKGRVR